MFRIIYNFLFTVVGVIYICYILFGKELTTVFDEILCFVIAIGIPVLWRTSTLVDRVKEIQDRLEPEAPESQEDTREESTPEDTPAEN